MGTQLPSPKKGRAPIFRPFLLWPNGRMHQDTTWYGGRSQPRRLCVRWGPSYPQKKRPHPSSPIFGPCLLWANGWIDEDATWYGSRPRPRPHCVRRGPTIRERGTAAPVFSAHVYCGDGHPSQLLHELLYKSINLSIFGHPKMLCPNLSLISTRNCEQFIIIHSYSFQPSTTMVIS